MVLYITTNLIYLLITKNLSQSFLFYMGNYLQFPLSSYMQYHSLIYNNYFPNILQNLLNYLKQKLVKLSLNMYHLQMLYLNSMIQM